MTVWESPIHGLGLFTTREFKKGATICRYLGELLSKEQMDSYYGKKTAEYAIHVERTEWYLDAKAETDGPGRWINHSRDNRNVEFVSRIYQDGKPGVEVVALRDLKPSEELLVDYGIDFVFE